MDFVVVCPVHSLIAFSGRNIPHFSCFRAWR